MILIYPLTATVAIYLVNGGSYIYLKSLITEQISYNRQTEEHRMAQDSLIMTSLCNGSLMGYNVLEWIIRAYRRDDTVYHWAQKSPSIKTGYYGETC